MTISEFKKRIITSFILLIMTLIIIISDFILVFSIIVFGVLSLLEYFNLIQRITTNRFLKIFLNTLFIIFISVFCILFFYISITLQMKLLLFIFLFGCIFSDIGGYIFGKIIQGPKLTKISPNKTISGSIGSFIFTLISIGSFMFFLTSNFNFKVVILSIITSSACQLGDLFFSFLKRKAKIKDTGNFLPGHGGVLDRLDGVFFGLPAGFITFLFFYL